MLAKLACCRLGAPTQTATVDFLTSTSGVQAKGLFGFVSNAVHNPTCRIEVAFTKPGSETPVDTIQLKAQGQHPAEEVPLIQNNTGGELCGQVKITAVQGKLDHQGIRVQLIGAIELVHAGVKHQEFLSQCAFLTSSL